MSNSSDLLEKKEQQLSSTEQIILFDFDGIVLESDQGIAEVEIGENLFQNDIFLQGVKEVLLEMKVGQVFEYESIYVTFFERESYYDFSIEKVDQKEAQYFRWKILEFAESQKNRHTFQV